MFCGGSSFIQGVLKECSFVLYEMNFFKMDMGDSKRVLQVQAFTGCPKKTATFKLFNLVYIVKKKNGPHWSIYSSVAPLPII